MDSNKLLKILESITLIEIKGKDGISRVVYEKYKEGINDKVKS